jgi:hypothetical protein
MFLWQGVPCGYEALIPPRSGRRPGTRLGETACGETTGALPAFVFYKGSG